MSCDTCLWWKAGHTQQVGECRRNAPASEGKRPGYNDTDEEFSRNFGTNRQWPQTSHSDWCGQFEKRHG